jgi:Patatin-like phospholipase
MGRRPFFKLAILSLFLNVCGLERIPMSLTVSGAVSLGAYQAGYQYVANDWIRKNRDCLKVCTITGASAGAINALVMVLSLADSSFCVDTNSLFYRTWVPVGYDTLIGGGSAIGVFKRDFFDVLRDKVLLPQIANPPPGEDVDVVLGITATRMEPEEIKVSGRFTIPNVEDKFLVRMKRIGNGAWELRNYLDPKASYPVPILPFHTGNSSSEVYRNDLRAVCDLVYASSGFPAAFPPKAIWQWRLVPGEIKNLDWDTTQYSLWEQISLRKNHVPGNDSKPTYMDGGVFDNAPLRLASNVISNGLTIDSLGIRWNPCLSSRTDTLTVNKTLFVYLSQDNIVFPQYKSIQSQNDGSITSTFMSIVGNLASSAHAKEIRIISDKFPEFDQKLKLTNSYTPTMSAYLMNFLGFFERPFRVFDFYLGMYDSQRYLAKVAIPSLKSTWPSYQFSSDLEATRPERANVRYKLVKMVYDTVFSIADSCVRYRTFVPDSGTWNPITKTVDTMYRLMKKNHPADSFDLGQEAIMLQTSIDRLWSRWACRRIDPVHWDVDKSQEDGWRRMTNFRPVFFKLASINPKEFRKNVIAPTLKSGGSGELDALLYLLGRYRYTYQNMFASGPQRASIDASKSSMADKFTGLIDSLASHQDAWIERRYSLLARPISNFFYYVPRTSYWHFGAGTEGLTLGASHSIAWPKLIGDVCLSIGKGSKANIGAQNVTLGQWYPPISLHCGFLPTIYANAVFQSSIGGFLNGGKDWMLNSVESHLATSWTFGLEPLVCQMSLLELIYVRTSWGGQKLYDFESRTSSDWDWTRINLQVGLMW